MSLDIKNLREIAQKATQERTEACEGNYPFYVSVTKPAPSLSKHDDSRPTYWAYADGVFVLTFNPKLVQEMLDQIESLQIELNLVHALWSECTEDRLYLNKKLKTATVALEKISDPRKRNHKEPDYYTALGCVMNIADVALSAINNDQLNEENNNVTE